MISVNKLILTVISLLFLLISRAPLAEEYQINAESLAGHVKLLASDSLEGREVGEPGELKSARHISSVFEAAGLVPYGNASSFIQPFDFTKEIVASDKNKLSINGTNLNQTGDYTPLKMSASLTFEIDQVIDAGYGITVADKSYDDYADIDATGVGVLIRRYAPDKDDFPNINFDDYITIQEKIDNALKHNVAAIFLVTPKRYTDSIETRGFAYVTPKEIPIIWLHRAALEKTSLSLDETIQFSVSGLTDLVAVRDTGYNVVGVLPTDNDTSILIGAHHDHLGWGTATSLYRGDEKKIHYGADDNGSGVAAMLELARQFGAQSTKQKYSIIFAAFSGEERGLLGSSHIAKKVIDDPRQIRAMLNLDMIGRLAEQENGLAIMGTGTCIEFKDYFDSLPDQELKLTFKEAGIGPSDHTSFYNREIPVLFFFTGAHADYHKPSDTWEKLDYDGLVKVSNMITNVTRFIDQYSGQLTFQKVTDNSQGKQRSRSKVKLGVMPDYTAEVKGLKVDAVSPGQVGEKAGVLAGDIIIKIGNYDVDDIYGYMNAMRKLNKGDRVTIIVERLIDSTTIAKIAIDVIF